MTSIGVALLVIVVLILWFVCNPVSYSLRIVGRHPYEVEVRLRWWRRLCSLHFAYKEGKPFFKEVYFLGRMKVGDAYNYQEWLNQRVQEEVDKPLEGDDISSYEEWIDPKGEGQRGEEPALSLSLQEAEQLSEAKKVEKENEEKAKEKKEKPSYDPLWWTKHVTSQDFWGALMKMGQHTMDHTKPHLFHVEGRFGIDNPYRMGILSAFLYSQMSQYMKDVELTYVEYACEGSLTVEGRVYPIVMAWYGTWFLLSRPIRRFLGDGARFARAKRKEKKAKEKEEALA